MSAAVRMASFLARSRGPKYLSIFFWRCATKPISHTLQAQQVASERAVPRSVFAATKEAALSAPERNKPPLCGRKRFEFRRPAGF